MRRNHVKTWVLIPLFSAIGGMVIICAGVIGYSQLLLKNYMNERATPPTLPIIQVSPNVTSIRFGMWRRVSGKDRLGHDGQWLLTEVIAIDKKAHSLDYKVEQFNETGRKLNALSWMSFPDLKPGERGEGSIRLEPGTSKITIEHKDR